MTPPAHSAAGVKRRAPPRRGAEAAEALRLSEEKFAKAFRISPDAMLISSFADGRIIDANESFFRMTSYTPAEVIGRQIEELGIWLSLGDRQQLLDAVQAAGGVREMEFEFQSRTGAKGVALVSADLIEIAGETCLITISHDITAQKQTEAKLREYTAELQARNAELESFAHMVAHDLKSPLSNIMGFAEYLQGNPVLPEEERVDYINTIARNAAKLRNIIDELLLLAQTRKDEVELLPLDMTSIVAEVQLRLAFMIGETRAVLKLPGAWPPALGYASWVEEVWMNYVSNAIQYGGRPPQVELGSEKLPDGRLRFWVYDNGRGISPEEQVELFTAFGKKSKARATGHGLGLSIVKQIVEKMGGQVGVESTVGQGSTFWFTLPPID